MKIIPVKDMGEDAESFESYLAKWPQETYSGFPVCLIENWVYRHFEEFKEYWLPIGALEWSYERCIFSNEEISTIAHLQKQKKAMVHWGDQLFHNKLRKDTWLASYMLSKGTTPSPILVLKDGGNVQHPCGRPSENMCVPYQLIEGHMRTAYLWGMQRKNYPNLKIEHDVWVARIKT